MLTKTNWEKKNFIWESSPEVHAIGYLLQNIDINEFYHYISPYILKETSGNTINIFPMRACFIWGYMLLIYLLALYAINLFPCYLFSWYFWPVMNNLFPNYCFACDFCDVRNHSYWLVYSSLLAPWMTVRYTGKQAVLGLAFTSCCSFNQLQDLGTKQT